MLCLGKHRPFLGIAVHIDDKQVMDDYGCEKHYFIESFLQYRGSACNTNFKEDTIGFIASVTTNSFMVSFY